MLIVFFINFAPNKSYCSANNILYESKFNSICSFCCGGTLMKIMASFKRYLWQGDGRKVLKRTHPSSFSLGRGALRHINLNIQNDIPDHNVTVQWVENGQLKTIELTQGHSAIYQSQLLISMLGFIRLQAFTDQYMPALVNGNLFFDLEPRDDEEFININITLKNEQQLSQMNPISTNRRLPPTKDRLAPARALPAQTSLLPDQTSLLLDQTKAQIALHRLHIRALYYQTLKSA